MKNKKSLLETHPNVAAQWHPTKNNGLTPSDVLPKSHKRAWWLCDKGHEWDATISNVVAGKGCPICQGRRVGSENNLYVRFPDIAQSWHSTNNGTLLPYDVTPGSNKKVWWQCKEGHEWQSVIAKRVSGRGCPYCSGRRKTFHEK